MKKIFFLFLCIFVPFTQFAFGNDSWTPTYVDPCEGSYVYLTNGTSVCSLDYPMITATQTSRDVWSDDDVCRPQLGVIESMTSLIESGNGFYSRVYSLETTQTNYFPGDTIPGNRYNTTTNPALGSVYTCEENGGVWYNTGLGYQVCRISGASAPFGWQRYQNWSTTIPSSAPNISCGTFVGCTTEGHNFSNQGRETCGYQYETVRTYGPRWARITRCDKNNSGIHYATITEVGILPSISCSADTVLPIGQIAITGTTRGTPFSETRNSLGTLSGSPVVYTKDPITIYPYGIDTTTSGLKSIELQVSVNGGTFTRINFWDRNNGRSYGGISRINEWFNPSSSLFFTQSPVNGNSYVYKVISIDRMNNRSEVLSSTITFDTVTPQFSDIVSITPTLGTKLLANNNQPINISVSNAGGSPIIQTYAAFEQHDNPSNVNYYHHSSGNLAFTTNIEKVDNQRISDGSRPYALYIGYICDQAGNCNNTWMQNLEYSVFSNSLFIVPSLNQNLSTTINIANGSITTLSPDLKDIYGNLIIPASGLNRTIDFSFSYRNTLYLDQYKRQGLSSVFIKSPSGTYFRNLSLAANTFSASNQVSSNGLYPFEFKVYSPTANSSSMVDPQAEFIIQNLLVSIRGDLGERLGISLLTSPVDAYFQPLYSSTISGELKTTDFYEGRIQRSLLQVLKSGISPTGFTNPELKVEFGTGARQTAPGLRIQYDTVSPPTKLMSNGPVSDITTLSTLTSLSNDASQDYNLFTKLVRLGGSAVSTIQLYLSTHITYLISNPDTSVGGNLRVSYNGDIVNKSNYYDDLVNSSGSMQQGVKITGVTTSKNNTEINERQNQDIQVFGKLDKSILKKDIISNVYKTVKNISLMKANGVSTNGTKQVTNLSDFSSNSDGAKGSKNGILYFGNLNGLYVEITKGSVPKRVQGAKTIIVIGGDLLISENIYYGNSSDILGIAVLKDEKGKGGNIYIHPDVTNIVGTIVADGSILSGRKDPSDPSKIQIIDDNIPNSFDILKNQLHIYGSIMSENTLGGSRLSVPICPFFVKKADCTLEVSERYDLNFLRRYNLVTRGVYDGLPYGNFSGVPSRSDAKVSGGGTCELISSSSILCSNPYSGLLKRTITDITNAKDSTLTPSSDPRSYGRYSVIIEFNPSISKIQPPLFGK